MKLVFENPFFSAKVNQGFEALSEKDSVYKPVYCDIKWRIYDT